MADRLHALAFNELSAALSMFSRFVSLSEREEITRQLVAVVRGETSREVAERVLLVSEIARGLRCPLCHGKPAVQPHFLEKNPRYRCGGGHVWTRPAVVEGASAHVETILREVAESGELPPVPNRVEREG